MRRLVSTRALARALLIIAASSFVGPSSYALDSAPAERDRAREPAGDPPARSPEGFDVELPRALGSAWIVPPRVAPREHAPVVVLLHGMCDDGASFCRGVARDALGDHVLVCPRATSPCAGGGTLWAGGTERTREVVLASLDAVDEHLGARADSRANVLLAGFSQGAYVATQVASAAPGPFSELLLVGARVRPEARRLRANGVERVMLAAGDFDGSRLDMSATARALDRAGVRARFGSLGRVGHAFAPSDDWLRDALGWLGRRDD